MKDTKTPAEQPLIASSAFTPTLFALPRCGLDPHFGISRSGYYDLEKRGLLRLVRFTKPGNLRGKVLVSYSAAMAAVRKLAEQAAKQRSQSTQSRTVSETDVQDAPEAAEATLDALLDKLERGEPIDAHSARAFIKTTLLSRKSGELRIDSSPDIVTPRNIPLVLPHKIQSGGAK